MWILRLLLRFGLALVGAWMLVALGCGVPAQFQIYFTACGHNAYIWLLPAVALVFWVLGLFAKLRLVR